MTNCRWFQIFFFKIKKFKIADFWTISPITFTCALSEVCKACWISTVIWKKLESDIANYSVVSRTQKRSRHWGTLTWEKQGYCDMAETKETALCLMDPNLERTFKGHKSYISSVAFSPSLKQLASGSGDNSVMLWNFKPQLRAFKFIGHKVRISIWLTCNFYDSRPANNCLRSLRLSVDPNQTYSNSIPIWGSSSSSSRI